MSFFNSDIKTKELRVHGAGNSTQGKIEIYDADDSNKLTLSSNATISSDIELILPNTINAEKYLKTDASGNLEFSHPHILEGIGNSSNSVVISTDQGTSETILINSIQGTSNSTINLDASSGGITLNTNTGFFITSQSITVGNGGNITSTTIGSPTLYNPTKPIVFLIANSESNSGTYYWDLSGFGGNGQQLTIFFDDRDQTGIDVVVDLGTNRLITGTGLASKVKMTTLGNSIQITYFNSLWFIINTGGEILA